MERNSRQSVWFHSLVDKVNEHMMIYGNLDLLSDYERVKAKEWQIPVMNLNSSVVTKGIATGTFVADSINHDLEYIGAPCGTEDNSATGTYAGFGYRHGIGYPKEGVNSRQVINLNNLEEEFNEQFNKELKVWDSFMQKIDDKHYSKLSNVNINNGQDSTFCFSSYKDKPAPQGSKPSDFIEEHFKLADKLKNKTMKTSRVIELTESDVNAAIQAYIKDKLSDKETSQTITYITGIRSANGKGEAKEYVKKVIVEIDES